ncbi:DTW domain-containing protein [Alginatibacterium sediminis]|uniref:tRNA-uridine aminocarboxypropyltransferase n=1 Tax=Alginatibacterium sediminis TaxID=2164068 RepID=A0A420E6P9_9ALTE|nr:tRNA-uridine aminocarboxypropyltransferase [Alginatibacterium sediminis]RKF14297.1 DTW domain-containing protein [Alginatibacterium sediminis]
MTKRAYCDSCRSAQRLCFCDQFSSQVHRHSVTIIQHPDEAKHAKGSAWMCERVLDKCQIIVGEQAADFQELATLVASQEQHWALLYPSEFSKGLVNYNAYDVNKHAEQKSKLPEHWIIIDATWRKAYKMLQLNPWLHAIPHFHFENAPPSAYTIRKAPSEHHLSTLEAVALLLENIEDFNGTTLRQLLKTRIEQQQQHMSPKVLKRYKTN